MNGAIIPVLALLAALIISGCAQDPTVQVNVYVNDEQGKPVDGANVSAYSNYRFGTGAEKWTRIDGTLTSTGTTKDGRVTLNILPGNYAFKAGKDNATGGEEKLIVTRADSVYITIRGQTAELVNFSIRVVDGEGNTINVETTPVYYTGILCYQNGPCEIFMEPVKLYLNPASSSIYRNQTLEFTFTTEGYEPALLQVDGATAVNGKEYRAVLQRKGSPKTIRFVDGKAYPYDETDTTGIYDYVASFTADGSSITGYKIANSMEKWNNKNPIYNIFSYKQPHSADFGKALPEGTPGKNFERVIFYGFTQKEPKSIVEIGKDIGGLDSSAKGGLKFRGADDTQHTIPFALELDDSETGSTFIFDGKTIYYKVEYESSTSEKIKSVTFKKDNSTGTIIETVTRDGSAVALTGAGDRKFKYNVFAKKIFNRLWLVLAAGNIGQDESGKIQYGKEIIFAGTAYPSSNGEERRNYTQPFYIPKDTDFDNIPVYSKNDAYFVANFRVLDYVSDGNINIFIDTADGGLLGPFPNNNISEFSSDVEYYGTPAWRLTSGGDNSYLNQAYTDAGTIVGLGDDKVGAIMPQNAEKVKIVVCEKECANWISFENITLKIGESDTTKSGIKVTYQKKEGDYTYVINADDGTGPTEISLTPLSTGQTKDGKTIRIDSIYSTTGEVRFTIILQENYANAKEFLVWLSSAAGEAEVDATGMNALTNTALPSLINDSAFME